MLMINNYQPNIVNVWNLKLGGEDQSQADKLPLSTHFVGLPLNDHHISLKIYLKWISLLKLCKVDLRWTLKSCANILKFIQTFNHPSPFFILSKRVRNKNSIDFRFFFYPSLNEKKNLQQHAAVEFLYQWWMNHDDTYQIVFRRSS